MLVVVEFRDTTVLLFFGKQYGRGLNWETYDCYWQLLHFR
jgi:hypothetical protein